MKQDQPLKHETPPDHAGANHFYQWLIAFAPPAAITLAALTVFREVIVRSIASSAHPVLVYVILTAYFLGLIFCAFALHRFQREARYILGWEKSLSKADLDALTPKQESRQHASASIALSALNLKLPQAERQSRFDLEVGAFRSVLGDQLAYANFISGALIGLGLVGTFVGLLGTLEDLGAVFGSLAQTGNSELNPTAVFSNMVNKLQDPMKGMGTAFVSSLYGLLGSLLVGLCALSVSKSGGAVIKELQAAGRMHAALYIEPPLVQENPSELAQKVYHLQALLEKMLRAQIDTEGRLQNWLENGENRIAKMLAKTLEANWTTSSEMLSKHHQVTDRLSALLGAHDDNSQILASRITEQDHHLRQMIDELGNRINSDQTSLREELVRSIERTHGNRTQQVEALFKSIQGLSGLTERTSSVLQEHLQKQSKVSSQDARMTAPKKTGWSLGLLGRGVQTEPTDGLTLLAKSIERQTLMLEVFIRNSPNANANANANASASASPSSDQKIGT